MKKVPVLGSGALKIDQAGEFDYSGSQALKTLREEGISSVLVNPNTATIQASGGITDQVYFLPVAPYFVEEVTKKEHPGGILLTFGRQTVLSYGTELYTDGVLDKYGVHVLGTSVETIVYTEDCDLFVRRLDEIEMKTPVSQAVGSMEDTLTATCKIGYPVMTRSAYALGGLDSGICVNEEEFLKLTESSFAFFRQILVEEFSKGWRGIESEMVHNANDRCFAAASMEDFDPPGIHTDEFVVVAPTCSSTDEQVKMLRELSMKYVRRLGVVDKCSIQHASNVETNNYRAIEVNARLSRSPALAFRTTGYPFAFATVRIVPDYTLDQIGEMGIPNSAYGAPQLGYLICKVSRWDLTKFIGVPREISSSVKSVGRIIFIDRSFEKIIQKGLHMVGQGAHGFVGDGGVESDGSGRELSHPIDLCIFAIIQTLEREHSIDHILKLTKIDPQFFDKLRNIVDYKNRLSQYNEVGDIPADVLCKTRVLDFSDFQIICFVLSPEGNMEKGSFMVRAHCKELGILPAVKRINTATSGYPELANYLYMVHVVQGYDVSYYKNERSVVVPGSGAYRIGSSVEFDWCSVNAIQAACKLGYKSIIINYNPEAVPTNYDMCDRLYFDELSFERVLDVVGLERPRGVIMSVGGQVSNNLTMKLHHQSVPVLGTSPISIDHAENHNEFSTMLDRLSIDQPAWQELISLKDVKRFAEKVGYPVLVRPSYVLSDATMSVCYDERELENFLKMVAEVSKEHPVVVSQPLQNTEEVEFDAMAQNGGVVEYVIPEHMESVGAHSSDAMLMFPIQEIYFATARHIREISRQIAKELDVSGPFDIRFLTHNSEVKVIECNSHASHSFPFVLKALERNFIETTTKVMLDAPYFRPDKSAFDINWIDVKTFQFSSLCLYKADPVLDVDMPSVGGIGCIGDDSSEILLNSMITADFRIPSLEKGVMFSSGAVRSKVDLLDASRIPSARGYKVYATASTAAFPNVHGVNTKAVFWLDECADAGNSIVMMVIRHKFGLIVSIPKNHSKCELINGYKIRRGVVDHNTPLIASAHLAGIFIEAFCEMKIKDTQIRS